MTEWKCVTQAWRGRTLIPRLAPSVGLQRIFNSSSFTDHSAPGPKVPVFTTHFRLGKKIILVNRTMSRWDEAENIFEIKCCKKGVLLAVSKQIFFFFQRRAFTLQLRKLFPPEFTKLITNCYSTIEWFKWVEKSHIFCSAPTKHRRALHSMHLLWCFSRSCHLELDMMSPLLLLLLLVTGTWEPRTKWQNAFESDVKCIYRNQKLAVKCKLGEKWWNPPCLLVVPCDSRTAGEEERDVPLRDLHPARDTVSPAGLQLRA